MNKFISCNRGYPYDSSYRIEEQCRICWLYYNNEDYKKLWNDHPPLGHGSEEITLIYDPIKESRKPPSITQMLKTFVEANVAEAKHRSFGKPGPTEKEKESRRQLCDACEYRDKKTDSCMVCGCSLEAKWIPPILLGKLDMATQNCPVGKWAIVGGAEMKCGSCGQKS